MMRLAKRIAGTISADPVKREAFRHWLVSRIARHWGFRTYGMNARWHKNQEFKDAWVGFPDLESTIHDRRFNLFSLAKAFSHVPGDLAECGVYRGRGSHLMLVANQHNDKRLFGFDSFAGLSEPLAEDLKGRRPGEEWVKHHFTTPEETAVKNLAGHGDRAKIFKGWIPDRFEEAADRTFSFVHIDVDLYQPTLDSFAFFFPRLSNGGAIVCDDYGSAACPGARKAVDEFAASVGLRVAELSTFQAVLFKPC